MDVFQLRERLIGDYAAYASSFININDKRVRETVSKATKAGAFWPEPLIQLNPSFQPGAWISDLVRDNTLHSECDSIFRVGKQRGENRAMRLHQHQLDAVQIASQGHNYVLTTGTGSGKSLSYIVPIVDHVLRNGSGRGIQAIIVYPMNALANSQEGELQKFLTHGYDVPPVTFAKYTGQEKDEQRQAIIAQPPDILLTNYVMLELLLTRTKEQRLIEQAHGLRFLVLDELHTYRGRQGADVALLVRRVRDRLVGNDALQVVGTSATLASGGSYDEQRAEVARVATQLFGATVQAEHIIGETLQRASDEPDMNDPAYLEALRHAVEALDTPTIYADFVAHPLSRWIESVFGVQRDDESNRLIRSQPQSIVTAANLLSEQTGLSAETCSHAIERWLMAGYEAESHPETGLSPFAFRLHQFISPGDAVYASIEPEDTRYLTVHGQHYAPESDKGKVLHPLVFCRECGQEYYSVRLIHGSENERSRVTPRDFRDHLDDEDSQAGYLFIDSDDPWPDDADKIIKRLPDDWLEDTPGGPRIRKGRQKWLPRNVRVLANGQEDSEGQPATYIPSEFRFCLHCGVSYAPRQNDFGKLATLSSEGRSSATTILSMSTILKLREGGEDDPHRLPERARKLLSFFEPLMPLEPEQMASLQAALKRAIEARYQLEDNELATEPLPAFDDRRLILFQLSRSVA